MDSLTTLDLQGKNTIRKGKEEKEERKEGKKEERKEEKKSEEEKKGKEVSEFYLATEERACLCPIVLIAPRAHCMTSLDLTTSQDDFVHKKDKISQTPTECVLYSQGTR